MVINKKLNSGVRMVLEGSMSNVGVEHIKKQFGRAA